MDEAGKLSVSAAVDDAAWRAVGLRLEAGELPPGDSRRERMLDEADSLRRRIEVLALDQPPHICPPSTMTV